jgi:hypothetical protein
VFREDFLDFSFNSFRWILGLVIVFLTYVWTLWCYFLYVRGTLNCGPHASLGVWGWFVQSVSEFTLLAEKRFAYIALSAVDGLCTNNVLICGATQPPIQWVPGALSLGVKRPGREADHSPPSSAEVKEWVELYLHFPNTPSWCGARLKHREKTLPFIPSLVSWQDFVVLYEWLGISVTHETHY